MIDAGDADGNNLPRIITCLDPFHVAVNASMVHVGAHVDQAAEPFGRMP